MEVDKQVIRTYSRRQPITRYESRAALVPTYTSPTHVRESRLNDKTLVVDNFDDTFDRLTTGVVVPSPENSLNENGVAKKTDSVVFDVFKVPLQIKKNGKPRQKDKPKKKDLVSKVAAVKRKKTVYSEDSDSSDQEETKKKQSRNKKPKEKVKKVVKKKKKNVSPVKVLTDDKLVPSESTDENAPNNIDDKSKENTETDDNFKKPKELSVNQRKIQRDFQASTPRISKVQNNMDALNISPVVMNITNERTRLHFSMDEEQAETAADDQRNPCENINENPESNENNSINPTDNFVKPREVANVDLLTSTPRVNKIRMPVVLQHLSPIISNKDNRVTGHEKSSAANADVENNQNGEVESNLNDEDQVPSEQAVESVESPAKVSEIEHRDIEGNGETLSQEKTDTDESDHQVLPVSSVTSENNNQDNNTDRNDKLDSIADDEIDSLIANVETNKKQLLPENTQSYANSPLMFDDSEYVQDEQGKSNRVTDLDKVDEVEIDFSQNYSENIEQNSKESNNSKSAHVDPEKATNKNLNASTESSFYPGDWSNEYDSTYGYDQLKNNHEKDATVDSKLGEDEDENSTNESENTNNTSAANVTEINRVSNIDNTEIQSVENDEQEKSEDTLCNEDSLIGNSKNKSDEQGEHSSAPSISAEDNHDLTDVEEDNSQITIEEKQASHGDESTNEDNRNSMIVEVDDFQSSQITVEDKQSYRKDESSDKDYQDTTDVEENNFQNSQVTIEEKQSYHEDEDASLNNQQDESLTLAEITDLVDQPLVITAQPSKRRKTDTNEIMVFENLEDDQNEQNKEVFMNESNRNISDYPSVPEDTIDESVNTESTDDISLVKPEQREEIAEKLADKELRLVLSRINIEEYQSPIASRKIPIKRKSAKRASRKSEDTNDESISTKKKQETRPKSNSGRVTRRSVTEDKMQNLFLQYQCKNLTIFAVKLEDQGMNLTLRRGLKRKSREKSMEEDNDLDNSLTNGGLTDFLSKLNDPVKVTMRRKTQKRYDTHLAAINEDQTGQHSKDVSGKKTVTWGNDKRVTLNDIEEDAEEAEEDDHISQPIFLKPGKSWARSLSIINHFHNGKNLDELAAGRENWRHSVQTVLNMQPEAGRSHSQNHEDTQRESRVLRVSTQRESKSMRKSSIASNSRFSIRIIPGGKRSTLTDDLMDSQRISYISDRSRASRKTSLKIRRDTLIETEDDLIRSAKDIILKRCKQTSYEPFEVSFPDSYIDNCRKIGEGVYGEVFLYENGSEKSVIKIIPIEGDQLVNCEPQKKFHEILSEIIIAEELHKLRNDGEYQTNGFVEVNRIMCVIGKYPQKLINLWYAYDEQKQSENDCPSMFEEDQLYIILELAHGGQDLEAYTFQNASESYAIFLQTALTLAVAEQSLEFEHRDLHWGNLLISKTEDKHSSYKLGSKEISLPTKGVKVAVIDFTLSRMSYQGCKIFNDLAADPTLFEAQGEYQFDIYRMMRDNVNDDWQQFNPFTNILWMDYTLEKMITAVRYRKKTTKIHKSAIEDMKALRKEIMKYSSAFDFVTNCKKAQALFNST